jgi:hypothetical protein
MMRIMAMLLIDHITGYGEDGDYDVESFEPHDEGPNYDNWNGSLDDSSALDQFAGLFGGDDR